MLCCTPSHVHAHTARIDRAFQRLAQQPGGGISSPLPPTPPEGRVTASWWSAGLAYHVVQGPRPTPLHGITRARKRAESVVHHLTSFYPQVRHLELFTGWCWSLREELVPDNLALWVSPVMFNVPFPLERSKRGSAIQKWDRNDLRTIFILDYGCHFFLLPWLILLLFITCFRGI